MSDTLGTLEDKNVALERENFDLKMRIYYLTNKAQGADQQDDEVIGFESPQSKSILKQKDLEISQYKDTVRILRSQISDLQAEVVQLRLRLTAATSNNASSAVSATPSKYQTANVLHVEENRRREKEANQALAAHDEAVIRSLQEEIKSLRLQHLQDGELLGECAERSVVTGDKLKETEAALHSAVDRNSVLQREVAVLRDQLRRQDILLVKKYGSDDEQKLRLLLGGGEGGGGAASAAATSASASASASLQHVVVDALGQGLGLGLGLSGLDHSNKDGLGRSLSGAGAGSIGSTLNSPDATSRALTPVTQQKHSQLEHLLFNHQHTPTSTNNSTAANANANNRSIISASDGQMQLTSNTFLNFGAQTAWEELHQLRNEKSLLIKSISEKEVTIREMEVEYRTELQTLEDTLTVAAEEVERLEGEVKAARAKTEKWKAKTAAAEQGQDRLRVRVTELQAQRDEGFIKFDLDTSLQLSMHRAGITRSKSQPSRRASVGSTASSQDAGGSTGAPSARGRRASVAASSGSGSVAASKDKDKSKELLMSGDGSAATPATEVTAATGAEGAGAGAMSPFVMEALKQQHAAVVASYRQREGELLTALEGVVKRCQELEGEKRSSAASHQHSHGHGRGQGHGHGHGNGNRSGGGGGGGRGRGGGGGTGASAERRD